MRLTFKSNNPFTGKIQYYPKSIYDDKNTGKKMIDFNKQTECNNKLGQLEDIEEELGIDLVTLFKALKNGVYVRYADNETEHRIVAGIEEENITLCYKENKNAYMYFKDYGKTWALTREELL